MNQINNLAHSIISNIIQVLFSAEERRFQKEIDRLHDQNLEVSRANLDGFMFQGRFYRHSNSAAGTGHRRTLHLDLWPNMQAHLRDREKVELDKQQIKQVLFRLIDPCSCLQHIRDAIPDCIADTLPESIRSLDRMGNPDFKTLRDLRQYNQTLPKIEFYSAARLLY